MTNQRRSLSNRRGEIATHGSESEAKILRQALDHSQDESWRELTHGFHTYPGRMHPAIARHLVAELGKPGMVLFDPFLGSGTTLVEGMLAGIRGRGADIHPLAVRVARLKCSLWAPQDRERLLGHAEEISAQAHERARAKAHSNPELRRRLMQSAKGWFLPHVRHEVVNLLDGISQVEDSRVRDALEMIFSSILVKVSNQRADSSARQQAVRVRRGFTSDFFARRANELCAQLAAFRDRVPPETKAPQILTNDARTLRRIGDKAVDLVITSPPYLGTYDYTAHQDLRARVLNINSQTAHKHEIGSRRQVHRNPSAAVEHWLADLRLVLQQLRRVLRPGSNALVQIGTSRHQGRTLSNERWVRELAPKAGLRYLATATQHFVSASHGNPPNRKPNQPPPEHLLWLQRGE